MVSFYHANYHFQWHRRWKGFNLAIELLVSQQEAKHFKEKDGRIAPAFYLTARNPWFQAS
jgi:hypothetical protein